MIKRILFFFLVIAGIVSCKDDDNIGFDVPVEFPSISFKPVPGGAVMHYVLPDNLDIFGVRARYTNAFGEQLAVTSRTRSCWAALRKPGRRSRCS